MFDWVYKKISDKHHREATKALSQVGYSKKLKQLCWDNLGMGLESLLVKGGIDKRERLIDQFSRVFSAKSKNQIREAAHDIFVHAREQNDGNRDKEAAISAALVTSLFLRGAISSSRVNPRFSSSCDTLQTILEH